MLTIPTLQGRYVRVEPLAERHAPALAAALGDPALWAYIPWPTLRTEDDARRYIAAAHAAAADGTQAPFAIIDLRTGALAGTTRYTDVTPAHRGLEIGWTILGPAWQRTPVNTETKLLLLRHAFETLTLPAPAPAPIGTPATVTGCLRVQLKCDARNERSQRVILRLGATFEGRLRKHRVMPDGYIRDTMMYSITDDDWPGVKAKLEVYLQGD
jgi:RimJ/RimL family protein N-acetyltransferase